MDLRAALGTARELLDSHGLHDWEVGLDGARRRAGACHHGRRLISLSRHLTELHGPAEVRETVLHELAHALVGPEHGHDAVWRARARALGSTGERCLPEDAPVVAGDFVGRCAHGHEATRHRRPERVVGCGRCGSRTALLSWTWRGVAVRMHPRYVADLVTLAPRHPAAREQLELDAVLGGGPGQPAVQALLAPPVAPGTRVRLGGTGRFAGQVGVVESRGRSRYRVRTAQGLLTVPPALLTPLRTGG
ncbi:SprT-like domain-containing protein [Vallicoccus soli]|uniref:M48 family peptidase n=1 Tax=Vallicoccus soli TaxID=2339232 RepID=A0A3A3YUN1_9ACTN|nr:SprT-like domain-containing protein [Vallicoccus soli]RJK92776.1 M48 family peptidase [Vallicoccus soli]